ncbi:MAG: hypothetical protein OHK0039_22300 [Bacteroidia bacterium]
MSISLASILTLSAQTYSRSGYPAPPENKDLLRRFPCGGQVLFDERFDDSDTLPAGWQRLDFDGLAPREEIHFLTPQGGWQSTFDFKAPGSGNRILASPAWYADTIGQSEDWLITPLIQLADVTCLSWYAYSQDKGYPERYEVRISTSTPDTAGFFEHPPLLRVDAESDVFTYRSLSLTGYAGRQVYIAFRHTSRDRFILALDDVRLARVQQADIALFQVNPIEVPAGSSVRIAGALINRGLTTYSFDSAEVVVGYRIDGGAAISAPIRKDFVLEPNDTLQFVHDTLWTPTEDRSYWLEVWVQQVRNDLNPANDTLQRWQGIGAATSIGDPAARPDLRLYPNPAGDQLTVELPAVYRPAQLRVIDATGRQVRRVQTVALGEAVSVPLASLPAGHYFLQVEIDGRHWGYRFVKE